MKNVLQPRGLPDDLKHSRLAKFFDKVPGYYAPVTHLYSEDVDKLNLDECPIYKLHGFIKASKIEEARTSLTSYSEKRVCMKLLNQIQFAASGIIYTFAEWEALSPEARKAAVKNHKKHVHVEVSFTEKREGRGMDDLKQLHDLILKDYPNYRLLVWFDSA